MPTKPSDKTMQAAVKSCADADYGDGPGKPRKPGRRCICCGKFLLADHDKPWCAKCWWNR